MAEKFIAKLNAGKEFAAPIVTTLRPLRQYYNVEDYYQEYFRKNTGHVYCRVVIAPKLAKLMAKFKDAAK